MKWPRNFTLVTFWGHPDVCPRSQDSERPATTREGFRGGATLPPPLRSVVQQKLIVRLGSVPAVHAINPAACFSPDDPRRDKVMVKLAPYGFEIVDGDLLCPRAYTQVLPEKRSTSRMAGV